jgi:hypothetical protein
MKTILSSILVASTAFAAAQGHDVKPADALKQISFLEGEWKGKQEFNNPGGAAMVGDIVVHAKAVVGGRYIEELLSTTLPGRKPTDSRHFIGYDAKANKYKAWWFNDTSNVPMQLEGVLEGNKLVLLSSPGPDGTGGPVFRATYDKVSDNAMNYVLELQTGNSWRALFHNSYSK